jgi:hypothetical protein
MVLQQFLPRPHINATHFAPIMAGRVIIVLLQGLLRREGWCVAATVQLLTGHRVHSSRQYLSWCTHPITADSISVADGLT